MAYIFRIHNGAIDVQNDGWQASEELKKGNSNDVGINSIDDSIDGGNVGKIGTSIPTPFARIYLFETAFDFVTSNQGHSKKDNILYDQLVSQSLDLLQLIFEKGTEDKLRLYEWNGEAQVQALADSNIREGHKTLAESLKLAMGKKDYFHTIRLIEYDGVLLGGTSPMTLTYTSPNAVRLLVEKGMQLYSNDKSRLFVERGVKHLKDRSPKFQKYVCWLVKQIDDNEPDDSPLQCFKAYVRSQNINFEPEELEKVGLHYKELSKQSSGGPDVKLSVCKLSLRYNAEPISMKDSDFLMRPSVRCFEDPVPVVLPTDGTSAYDGWRYTPNEAWKSTSVPDWSIAKVKLEDRFLPINGDRNGAFTTYKYPWLTTDDFFESSVVWLRFKLNKDRFYFPQVANDGAQFLLPIKKEYFKYFTVKDLKENLICEASFKGPMPMSIAFTLKIRLQKDSITLRREYTQAADGEFKIVSSKGSSFGVFPFYRCLGEDDKKNEYSIYFFGNSDDPQSSHLYFHRQDADKQKLTEVTDCSTHAEVPERSIDREGKNYSKIYNLRNETSNSFDIIEMKIGKENASVSGLAIPLWFKPEPADKDKKTIISVDFGTSNTYVSYLEGKEAKPLTIGMEDQQMVLLNDKCKSEGSERVQFRNAESFGLAQNMPQYLREFVPSLIGYRDVVAEGEFIEFPIKTATIEKKNCLATDKLFSGLSIGFNIDNERYKFNSDRFKYVTNLKWNAEEHKLSEDPDDMAALKKDKNRIKAFCDQILWMLKNKLVMNGYSDEGQMMYFYPDSMSKDGRKIFEDAWNQSVKEIFNGRGFNIKVNEELESISPYYSLVHSHGDGVEGKSIANIDIGGGTTDYFILDYSLGAYSHSDSEAGKAYEASVFFAGNDLWETPKSKNEDNGFVVYMQQMVSHSDDEEAKKLLANCQNTDDLSSFFFKNDEIFGFSDMVSSQRKFQFVLFLHYAAIIHHFVKILKVIKFKEPEFTYPEILTFTGKGSEYIKMLSKKENIISQITTDLIKAFGMGDFKHIKILWVDNPKALTADGGIYKMTDPSQKVILFEKDAFGATPPKGMTTPYERVGKLCIGLPAKADGAVYKKSEVADQTVTDHVMEEIKEFANVVFYSSELDDVRKHLEFDVKEKDYKTFVAFAEDSYTAHSRRFLNNNKGDEDLEESVFFFALKNSLIKMSKYYCNYYIEKQKQ